MNVLCILIDSLNRHYLETYAPTSVRTPNLAAFARRAAVFENHFISCAPCMPARRNLLTGRREFLWRGWGPVEPFDQHLARVARDRGAVTGMVTDHYHYWEPGGNGYIQGFDSVEMIRGQEGDFWRREPVATTPAWVNAIDRWRPNAGKHYYQNVREFQREEDFFSPRVMTGASQWLERNHRHPQWLLWTESFDVHEPFHVPEPYRSMYTDDLDPVFTCWPPYQNGVWGRTGKFWAAVTERELKFIRAQYAGKVTMMDHWLGRVFDEVDRLKLWDDTMIIVTSDHGHELGEKGRFGKQYPHYDLNARIPLFVWHPALKQRGQRFTGITQAMDIHATIAEALGADPATCSPDGRSFLPALDGRAWTGRECALYGTFGAGAVLTTPQATYASRVVPNRPLYWHSTGLAGVATNATSGRFIPGVDCVVWRQPMTNADAHPELLFDRQADPDQNHDLAASQPARAAAMRDWLRRELQTLRAPEEQYIRLGLDS